MKIEIRCPSCQKRLIVGEHLVGKTAKCPKCHTSISIPNPAAPPVQTVQGSSPKNVINVVAPPNLGSSINQVQVRSAQETPVASKGNTPTTMGNRFCDLVNSFHFFDASTPYWQRGGAISMWVLMPSMLFYVYYSSGQKWYEAIGSTIVFISVIAVVTALWGMLCGSKNLAIRMLGFLMSPIGIPAGLILFVLITISFAPGALVGLLVGLLLPPVAPRSEVIPASADEPSKQSRFDWMQDNAIPPSKSDFQITAPATVSGMQMDHRNVTRVVQPNAPLVTRLLAIAGAVATFFVTAIVIPVLGFQITGVQILNNRAALDATAARR